VRARPVGREHAHSYLLSRSVCACEERATERKMEDSRTRMYKERRKANPKSKQASKEGPNCNADGCGGNGLQYRPRTSISSANCPSMVPSDSTSACRPPLYCTVLYQVSAAAFSGQYMYMSMSMSMSIVLPTRAVLPWQRVASASGCHPLAPAGCRDHRRRSLPPPCLDLARHPPAAPHAIAPSLASVACARAGSELHSWPHPPHVADGV
jgi:hypothetical protein